MADEPAPVMLKVAGKRFACERCDATVFSRVGENFTCDGCGTEYGSAASSLPLAPDFDLSRYDYDPDAVAWARAKVVRLRDKYRGFEQSAASAGKAEQASNWRRLANMLDLQMIGGSGCSIAAFDERLPEMAALRDRADERSDR